MSKIIKDLPIEKYHENKLVISSTGLKELKKSTRHFLYYLTKKEEKKSYFDFGNAFELAIMDRVNNTDYFEKEVCVFPDDLFINKALEEKPDLKSPRASKTYKALSDVFREKNVTRYIINDYGETESNESLNYMIDSCMNDSTIVKLLSNTEYQNSFFWKHKTGVLCKTRPDVNKKKKNVLIDIKTCVDASPSGFSRQAANLDYYLQAIMQIDGAISSGAMKTVDNYFWLAVEKQPPYNACIYEFQKYDIEWMFDVYEDVMQRASDALKLLKNSQDVNFTHVRGYGEQSENEYGILTMDIPLYYKYNNGFTN